MTMLFSLFFAHVKKFHSSIVHVLNGAWKRAVQERSRASAFLRKQSSSIGSIFKSEYFRLKSCVLNFVIRIIEALLVNAIFIAFARLVQKIFWIYAGIDIYAVVLIATQKDGYERVVILLEYFFSGGGEGHNFDQMRRVLNGFLDVEKLPLWQ